MQWNATWIWHAPSVAPDNLYLHFRGTFELKGPADAAKLYVTAGSLYKLWVNGQYVGRGPNPADPSYYYYDVHDVSALLKPGQNLIAVTTYTYGPKGHGIILQNYGPGGLLLELRDGAGATLAQSDESWRVIHAPEWDQNSELNNTLYGDFKEFRDLRRELVGWQSDLGFDDAAWQQVEVLGAPPDGPYPNLREREIPMLTAEPVLPVDAHWESASVTYAWRDDWEVYHEHALVQGRPLDTSGKPMEVRKTHADFPPSVLLDFGRLVTGYVQVSVTEAEGGVVDLLYGEAMHLVRIDRFTLRPGQQTLEPFGRRTFRYLKLLFPEISGRVLIDRVAVQLSTYPVDETASAFECSDPLVTRIYDVAKYTIRLSMLDHLVDCPGRERSFYGGDVYVESLHALYAFGDPRIIRKTIRQNFAIQFPQGGLPVVGPYSGFNSFYPSWSAFAALGLLDDERFTGSRELLEELWPRFAKLMDFAIGQMEGNELYLIGEPAKGGGIAKWMEGPRARYVAWSNLPFYVLMGRAAEAAAKLGKEQDAARYRDAQGKMSEVIRQYLVGEDGLFATWPRSARASHSPTYESSLLAWSGAVDEAAARRIAQRVLEPDMPPSGGGLQDFFVAHAAFAQGSAADGLAYVRRAWGDQIARGATTFWEHTRPELPKHMKVPWGMSYCHGWSAAPVYLLPAFVLGIRPLEPGFAQVLIEPAVGVMDWARGHVPTPYGPVSVSWEREGQRFAVRIKTPRPARVKLPGGVEKQVSPGVHDLTVDLRDALAPL